MQKVSRSDFDPAIHLLDESLPKKVLQSLKDVRDTCFSAQLANIEYNIYSISFSYNDEKHSRINDRCFSMVSNGRIHSEVYKYVKAYCRRMKIFFIAFPEFAPNELRLHWHGIVKGNELKVSNLKKYLTRYYGHVDKIKVLNDYNYWTYYIQKDNYKRDGFMPIIFHDPTDVYKK